MKDAHAKQRYYLLTVLVSSIVFTIVTFFFKPSLAYAELGVVAVLLVSYLAFRKYWAKNNFLSLKNLADTLNVDNRESFNNLPMPMTLVGIDGLIIWYNDLFYNRVVADLNVESVHISDYLNHLTLDEVISTDSVTVDIGKHSYTIYTSKISGGSKECYTLYFFDITQLKRKADKFGAVKPAVLLGYYDNYEDLFQHYSDSERMEIKSGIDRLLEKWCEQYACLLRRLGSERFIIVAHESDLQEMMKTKFEILNSIRSYKYNGKSSNITVSIGVGRGKTLRDCERSSRQALDMALSRGGDQVAVKTKEDYEFFGGVSSGADKTNKVKSRVVASAINQLIDGCSNVFIMGHRFSDLDSIGAAIGIYAVARSFNKDAFIVCDKSKSLANQLINQYVKDTGNNPFIEPLNAQLRLEKNSVLFVVDTHRREFAESPELLDKAESIIVIDHHRKAVDYIKNAVVFHHDIGVSSTSEMVAELIPYMGDKLLGSSEADALFAGIMLDTRNFLLRTGVRTFEAAAYLRGMGADAVRVKSFFATSIENYKNRNEIISEADIYKCCAISSVSGKMKDMRIITSQAADEMLNITGVKASFVLFESGDCINISARSLGEINVQIIMENMGGGGHNTMAATQLRDSSLAKASMELYDAIDDYYSKLA